jgi:hypothetical protein
MKVFNHKKRYKKRNRGTKRYLLIFLAILACFGFLAFHTVKTDASITVKKDVGKAAASAVNETKFPLNYIVAQKKSPSAANSQNKPVSFTREAVIRAELPFNLNHFTYFKLLL